MKAALYLRLSRDEANQGIEKVLSNHRQKLIEIAERENYSYDIYEEISSGMNDEREKLNEMLLNIDQYDAVICHDFDRLTRSSLKSEQIKKILYMNQVIVITPTTTINFNNDSDDLLYSFSSILSSFEWKQIRKRMLAGKIAAVKQGKYVNSNIIPLGYTRNPKTKKLEINKEDAKIIRLIFERTIEGYSTTKIAKELKSLGYKTKKNVYISTSALSRLRTNVAYIGTVKMRVKKNGKVSETIEIEDAHEPIISKEEFLLARKIVEINNTKEFSFRTRSEIKLSLQGIIYCNHCGWKRYTQLSKNGVPNIKTCTCGDRGGPYIEVEKLVFQSLKKLKSTLKAELEKLDLSDTSNIEDKLIEQQKQLNKNLEANKKKLKNIAMMRASDEIDTDMYKQLKEELDTQISNIENQLESVKNRLSKLSSSTDTKERYERILDTLEVIEKLDVIAVNEFLKSFVKKIHYSTKDQIVKIEYL